MSFELLSSRMVTHILPNTIPSTGRHAYLMYQPVNGGEPLRCEIDGNNVKCDNNLPAAKYRLGGWITFD